VTIASPHDDSGEPLTGPRADATLVLWNGDASELPRWTSMAADGSRAVLAAEPCTGGSAMRLDYDLVGPTGWAIARRSVDIELPEHYVLVLRIRGLADPNQLQLKLVDPSHANVWWWRRPDFVFPRDSEVVLFRREALEFAWGPASGGDPTRIDAIEIALQVGTQGPGSLWIEDLRIEPRDIACTRPHIQDLAASSEQPDYPVAYAIDGDHETDWRPAADDAAPWLQADLGRSCEWGGLVLDFADPPGDRPHRLLSSEDGTHWKLVAEEIPGPGARFWIRTADAEGRYARLEFPPGSSPRVLHCHIVPLVRAVSPARYITKVAREAPRGMYPRHLLGELSPWAIVGGDGEAKKGLLSEDGALEVAAESYSIEPMLWTEGRLVTWAEVTAKVSLADGHLPIPTVEWEAAGLRLRITAWSSGERGKSCLIARYELENTSSRARDVRLFLAVRPLQVNPVWQSVHITGGVAPITSIERRGDVVTIGGQPTLVCVSRADAFGAYFTEEGLATLPEGRLRTRGHIEDQLGFAHGVLSYDLHVDTSVGTGVTIAVPLYDSGANLPVGLALADAADWASDRHAEALGYWRTRLARVPIELPPCASAWNDTLKASLAWILVNREGPRIQPGPRCYRRSWIRDGTLTGIALAEMGFTNEANEFLHWYAGYQYDDGRIPCAVDHKGVDPVVENDSHGQFIWGIVELHRLTRDRSLLERMWPRIRRAAEAIEKLRDERTTELYQGEACYGLMPESISHEGYSSRPVHAYWDDLFAVLGLSDAADAAAFLGETERARHFAAVRNAMRENLHDSIRATIQIHGIDFVPGSVELGDFDPTSIAIALDPCGEGFRLPEDALARTFEKYWTEFEERRTGVHVAEAYTAYEVRNAVALMLLGQKERAATLLDWLIEDQRPPAWRQWPEVTTRNPRTPRFLGDLPHGWIASSFVRSVRRMLAYERSRDGALVLAAGVPAAWVAAEPGVAVHGLPTGLGPVDFRLSPAGEGKLRLTIGGTFRWPGVGVFVETPLDAPITGVVVDGRRAEVTDPRRICLKDRACEVVIEHGPCD
jgi:hypothetical protein